MDRLAAESIRSLLNRGEHYLVAHGVPNARHNTEWLLGHVLSRRSTDLYLESDRAIDGDGVSRFDELVKRRGAREPLQYILGSTEFMGLPFLTSNRVFIPRPDTEVLVEKVEALIQRSAHRRVLDLCTGSGVIAVSLAKRIPDVFVTAVDLSIEAVELTAKNAYANDVIDRVACVHGDALDFLSTCDTHFDVIVSNPPYIRSEDLSDLPPEVLLHEPTLSLDGGHDGLEFYRLAIPLLVEHLSPGGMVAFEIGMDQANDIQHILSEAGFGGALVYKDYANHDRVIVGRVG